MGLLEEYQRQHPAAFASQQQQQDRLGSGEYGFLIKFVIRLSGGLVQNARQANRVLLVAAVVFVFAAVSLYFWSSRSPVISAEEAMRDTPTTGLRRGAELPQ